MRGWNKKLCRANAPVFAPPVRASLPLSKQAWAFADKAGAADRRGAAALAITAAKIPAVGSGHN